MKVVDRPWSRPYSPPRICTASDGTGAGLVSSPLLRRRFTAGEITAWAPADGWMCVD